MVWTDERVQKLRDLQAAGLSYSQIARILGANLTRNAVLGKAYRMGLRCPEKAPLHKRRARKRSRQAARAFRERGGEPYNPKPPTPLPVEDIQPDKLVAFADLTDTGCRWIYGDPCTGGGFCPQTKVEGLPYCEVHRAKAYVVDVQPRRRKVTKHKISNENFDFLTVHSFPKVDA